MSNEQKVYAEIEQRGCVNELTIVSAFPCVDVFGIIRNLAQRGLIERSFGGAVKVATAPASNSVEVKLAEPQPKSAIWKQKRKYFFRLNPRKHLKRQIASRIVFYLAHISTGPIRYMTIYKNLHASRYRDYLGHDLWVEALEYLGTAISRKRGMIWLERETKRVSKLPWPYKRTDIPNVGLLYRR
jgi:hypothetical protein